MYSLKLYFYFFCFLGLLSYGATQKIIDNPTRIYTTPVGTTTIAVGPIGAEQDCSSGFVFLTSSSAGTCVQIADVDGNVFSTACNTSLDGATHMACSSFWCHISNPITGQIIVLDPQRNGSFVRTYGLGNIVKPSTIYVYDKFEVFGGYTWVYVTDASDNSLFWFYFPGTGFYTAPEVFKKIYTYPSVTGAPAGIFASDAANQNGVLYSAISGSTTIQRFDISSWNGFNNLAFTPLPDYSNTFANVGRMTSDFYFRVHVYDAGCSCVKIFDNTDTWVASVIGIATAPKALRVSRNHIYALDDTGVLRFEEKLQLDVGQFVNKRCSSQLGSISFGHTGGAFPMKYKLFPGGRELPVLYDYSPYVNASFTGIDTLPLNLRPAPIFFETYVNAFTYTAQRTFLTRTNSTVFPPYEGNYSLGVQFYRRNDSWITTGVLTMECFGRVNCMNARLNRLEFQLHLGLGNHSVELSFVNDADVVLQTWSMPSLSLDQWHLISIPLTFNVSFSKMIWRDLNKGNWTYTGNTFYIDNFIAYPQNYPDYYVGLIDFCNTIVKSPPFIVNNDKAIAASIDTQSVTCSADLPINGNLTRDGYTVANVTNGQGILTYSWIFPDANTSSNVVDNLAALKNYYVIYDNAVNSTEWYDSSSTEGGPKDTTYYHSAPYSYSMPMPGGGAVAIQFSYHGVIRALSGATLTFWFHGGQFGGQSVSLEFYKYSSRTIYIASITTLAGVSVIPGGVWLKATYNFPGSFSNRDFSSFQFVANPDNLNAYKSQNTIYFDDIVLNLKPVLRVTDEVGCSASVNEIVVPTPTALASAPVYTNVQCHGASDGVVQLKVQGGVAPYQYDWTVGGASVPGSSFSSRVTGLGESQVKVNISDSKGCTTTEVVQQVLQPPPLSLSFSAEPIKCYGARARITASMLGGNAPYNFVWNSASRSDPVAQPGPVPVFTDSLSGISLSNNSKLTCFGTGSHLALNYVPTHTGYCSIAATFNTSQASVVISGISGSLTKYGSIGFWIYLERAQDAQNLLVSVANSGATVSIPIALNVLANITANSWNHVYYNITGLSVSSINQLVITSGTPANMGRVLLDDIVLVPKLATSLGVGLYPGYSAVLSGTAGMFFLTAVDANGCSLFQSINISQPEEIKVQVIAIQTTSSTSATDGSIAVNATGGVPPYTYLWVDTNFTGTNITGLKYGAHVLQVRDADGCLQEVTFVVDVEERYTIRSYNKGLAAGLGVVAAIGILFGAFGLIMLVLFRTSHSKLGGFYSFVITAGVIIGCLSVVMLLPRPTDALCTAYPWLLGTGFTLVYSCLFLKTWALYRVWRNAINYKKSNLTAAKIMRTIVLALFVEFAVLAVWTAVDPPKVHHVKSVNHTLEAQCKSDTPTFWIIFVAIKGAWLVFGAILAVLTRNVMREYNESVGIAYSIYTILVLIVIAIPLGSLLDVVPGGVLVIEVIVPVLAFTSTLVIMFIKIWHATLFGSDAVVPGMRNGISPTTTGASKGSPSSSAYGASSKNSQNSRAFNSRDSHGSAKTHPSSEETSSAVVPI